MLFAEFFNGPNWSVMDIVGREDWNLSEGYFALGLHWHINMRSNYSEYKSENVNINYNEIWVFLNMKIMIAVNGNISIYNI